jgi:hypothetical protein
MISGTPAFGRQRVNKTRHGERRPKLVGRKKRLHARRRVRKSTSEVCDAEIRWLYEIPQNRLARRQERGD